MLPANITLNTAVLSPMTLKPTALCIFWDSNHNGSWDPDNIPRAVFPNGTVQVGPNALSILGPYIGWYDATTYFAAMVSGTLPACYTLT
jgi:hypothetical protein